MHDAGPSRRSARAAMTVAAFVAVAAGCDAEPRPGSPVEVRDSGGIDLVSTRPATALEADLLRVDETPVLRIGGPEGEEARRFHRVVGAVRDGDVLVVADAGSGELRWFALDGAHRGTAGGEGEGPGEFSDLSWVGAGEEGSIHAWDRRLRRLSTFRAGRFVGSVRPPLPDDVPGPVVHGVLRGGTVVASPGPVYVPRSEPGVQRPPMPVWLFSLEGRSFDTLASFPGRAVNLRPATNAGWIRTEVPFGPASFVAARGAELVVAESGSYELRYFDPAGDLATIVRVAHEPRAVTEDHLRAELERRLEGVPPIEEIREGVRASWESTPAPGTMPAFEEVLLDPTGHAWLRRPSGDPTEPVARWDVVGPDGAMLGAVATPSGLRVTDVGPDWVLGVWKDPLEVEHVQMHRLIRP